MSDNPLVSFVVPTVGRRSLDDAVRSLQAQTDGDWEAQIVRDGMQFSGHPRAWHGDNRVVYRERERVNSAGLTRNYALPFCRGRWIAFLDDDDELDPRYVALLRCYDEDPSRPDVVVFRMAYPDGTVLPDPDRPRLEWGHVGISYAVRREWFENGWFENEGGLAEEYEREKCVGEGGHMDDPCLRCGFRRSGHRFIAEHDLREGGPDRNEDIRLLLDLMEDGAGVIISPHVTYHVNPRRSER